MDELRLKAYSVSQGAKVLGISRSKMYDLISKDQVPHCHIGEKRILIPVKALEEWLERQTEKVM